MTINIDMQQVATETAEELGSQIGALMAELIAQRQSNRLLHAEVERLTQALAAATGGDPVEVKEPGPEPVG